jgi:hypothetical protein
MVAGLRGGRDAGGMWELVQATHGIRYHAGDHELGECVETGSPWTHERRRSLMVRMERSISPT